MFSKTIIALTSLLVYASVTDDEVTLWALSTPSYRRTKIATGKTLKSVEVALCVWLVQNDLGDIDIPEL